MLCYHQHLYPMCTKMMCLSVWQVGPWVSPGATSLQGAAWNPLASWILLAPKNWKRGWWQAARKDWLVTCTHRYHLRPVPRAGRGFRTSSVWQERRMRPVEQHTGGGGGDSLVGVGWEFEAGLLHPPTSPNPSQRCEPQNIRLFLLWGSSTDCGTFLKVLISGHKLSSPREAQRSCLSRTYLQVRLTHLANERSTGRGHPSWLLLFCALKHEM